MVEGLVMRNAFKPLLQGPKDAKAIIWLNRSSQMRTMVLKYESLHDLVINLGFLCRDSYSSTALFVFGGSVVTAHGARHRAPQVSAP